MLDRAQPAPLLSSGSNSIARTLGCARHRDSAGASRTALCSWFTRPTYTRSGCFAFRNKSVSVWFSSWSRYAAMPTNIAFPASGTAGMRATRHRNSLASIVAADAAKIAITTTSA